MNTEDTAVLKLYIGMDIHKKSWSVHFRTDLFDHRGFTMPPEPVRLVEYEQSRLKDIPTANRACPDYDREAWV